MRSMLNEILAEHTGQDVAKIESDTDRDFFMDAPDAVTYGLIDQVFDSRHALPSEE